MKWMNVVPVAPLRAEASHRSEMVSQLLFGELCKELETQGDFAKVSCDYDGYEGWCQRSQLAAYSGEDYTHPTFQVKQREATIQVNGSSYAIPFGAILESRETHKYEVDGYMIDAL